MTRIDAKTLFLLAALGFLTQGSTCDAPELIDSKPAAVKPSNSNLDALKSTNRDADTTDPKRSDTTDTTDTTNTGDNTGDAGSGDVCEAESECSAGLDCVGGICTTEGKLRISLVWEADTDLDIHVITPSGEELYYRNREGKFGGMFEKDGCLADRCEGGTQIETVIWGVEPPEGTYEFFAVNYDGEKSVAFNFDVSADGNNEAFSGTVAAGNGTKSSRFAVTVGGSTGTGELKITSHEHESWAAGPELNFMVETQNDDITHVKYHSDDEEITTSESGPKFRAAHEFTDLGEHEIKAKGYDTSGFELDNHKITIVVTDADGGLPNPSQGAVVSEKLLAKKLNTMGGVSLYSIQVSGRNDGADSNSNMEASASGQAVKRSSYSNAPGGTTRLNAKMLQGMYLMANSGYSFRVTSIAGGSHSVGSGHYGGNAFDVDTINGKSVSGNPNLARAFEAKCREFGARLALGPGDAGHSSHVHCEW